MRFGVAVVALAVAASSLVVGCSKKDGGASGESATTVAAAASKGSCDMRAKLSSCDNFKPSTDDDGNKAGCTILGGTFAQTLCSTDKAVATCEDDDSLTYYYSDGANGFEPDEAKAGCDLIKGKFVAMAAPAPEKPAAAAAPAAVAKQAKPAPKHGK